MDFELRPATPDDDAFVEQLYADVHSIEFAPLNLPPPALAQLMQMQARAQRMGYLAQFPTAEFSIIWAGPYRIGRLVVAPLTEEIRLVDIALLGVFRGHGVGSKILQDLGHRAAASELPLRLSVRAGNRAARLYARAGFYPTGGDAMNTEMEWRSNPVAAPQAIAAEASPAADVVFGASSAYFRSVQGRPAKVLISEAVASELTLLSVTPMKHSAGRSSILGDSFVLALEGPASDDLKQGIHALDFGDGAIEIFLGPVSREGDKLLYEAIFNREQPADPA